MIWRESSFTISSFLAGLRCSKPDFYGRITGVFPQPQWPTGNTCLTLSSSETGLGIYVVKNFEDSTDSFLTLNQTQKLLLWKNPGFSWRFSIGLLFSECGTTLIQKENFVILNFHKRKLSLAYLFLKAIKPTQLITQNSGCSSPLPAQFLSTEISRNFIYTYTPLYKAFYRGILSEWVCVNTYIKTSLQRRFCTGLIALRALKAEVRLFAPGACKTVTLEDRARASL